MFLPQQSYGGHHFSHRSCVCVIAEIEMIDNAYWQRFFFISLFDSFVSFCVIELSGKNVRNIESEILHAVSILTIKCFTIKRPRLVTPETSKFVFWYVWCVATVCFWPQKAAKFYSILYLFVFVCFRVNTVFPSPVEPLQSYVAARKWPNVLSSHCVYTM